jgi:hypothetical protein
VSGQDLRILLRLLDAMDDHLGRRISDQEFPAPAGFSGLSPAACATASFTSFLKIAAAFAAGCPVDLSAVVTNSLGWAHAQRVAEAVTTADGPGRTRAAACRCE